jgi:transposase
VKEAKGAGFEVICGLALKGGVKGAAERVVKEGFASVETRVRLQSSTFYAEKMRYTYGGARGWLVVCFNEKQKQEIKERRYDEIDKAIKRIKEGKAIKEGVGKYLRGARIRYGEVKKAEKYDGVSSIFSTKNLPASEIVRAYFEKDRIEKAFRCMKSLLEMDKIRFWLSERVEAHIFICYIAYLLLSVMDYKLKSRFRTSDMNSLRALNLMESMYRVHMHDPKSKTTIVKTVTLSKQQEEILRAINKKLLKCSEQKVL